MPERTCIKCGHKGPVEKDFPTTQKYLGQATYRRYCKPCYSSKVREWQKQNDTSERRVKKNKMTKAWRERMRAEGKMGTLYRKYNANRYGLTLEQYNQMLASQNGVCAICQQVDPEDGKELAIDHDHETNMTRGLLCGRCNKALGLFKDSSALLQLALHYLARYQKVS